MVPPHAHLQACNSRETHRDTCTALADLDMPANGLRCMRRECSWHRHTEDMDLASVNYLHCGAPKAWYCIPPAHRERFERLLEGLLPDMFRACPEFFRHKVRCCAPETMLAGSPEASWPCLRRSMCSGR